MGTSGKYKSEFCTKLIEHMSTGLSFVSFGAKAGVSEHTLHDWVHRYDEFAKAKALAEVKSLEFWEKLGVMAATGKIKGFQPAVWIFTMKCRFRKYGYRDVQEEDVLEIVDRSEAARARLNRLEKLLEERSCWQKNSSIPLDVVSQPSGLLTESSKQESKK